MTKAKLLAILDQIEEDLKKLAEIEKDHDYPYLYGYFRSSIIHAIALTEGDILSQSYKAKRNELERRFQK